MKSTAGQHFKRNKAAATERWKQQIENKKTFFLTVRRAVIWSLSEDTGAFLDAMGGLNPDTGQRGPLLEEQLERWAALGCLKWR